MSADFLDSNVVLCLASDDDRKASIVEGLLTDGPAISVQVLNECTNVLRKKRKADWPTIDRFVEGLLPITTVLPLTQDTNRTARGLAARHGFSWYDALIVASALEGGCARLITDDMHDGHRIDGLTIVNPFR